MEQCDWCGRDRDDDYYKVQMKDKDNPHLEFISEYICKKCYETNKPKKKVKCCQCGKNIPYRKNRLESTKKCLKCGNDVCMDCRYIVNEIKRFGTYRTNTIRVGVLCKRCLK